MRRLTYSPKVFVYIKDMNNTIHDLSNYVVRGRVSRKIDQVSTAEITLRNPNMMFTAGLSDNGTVQTPLFHPMDPITIYLERAPGFPVRVFTGFLDTTPYLQLFPGTIELKASCTLKRLLYTYFDLALPYTRSFMAAYGWVMADGTAISESAMDEAYEDKDEETGPKKDIDGTLGNLLFGTLKHIGGWDKNSIYIEPLPPATFDRLTALASEFVKNNEESLAKFKEILESLYGGGYGSVDGVEGTGDVSTGVISGIDQIVPKVQEIANKWNIPAELMLTVMAIETDFKNTHDPGSQYYGWFQMNINAPPYRYGTLSKKAPTVKQAEDLGIAGNAFASCAAGWAKAKPNLRKDLYAWGVAVQGVGPSIAAGGNQRFPDEWARFSKQSKQLLTQYGKKAVDDVPKDGTDRDSRPT